MNNVNYQGTKSDEFLLNLRRSLITAQTTSVSKTERLRVLNAVSSVLEYIIETCQVSTAEDAMLYRFFRSLLIKTKKSIINIHTKPETFNDEIGFLSILSKITQ